ncbi:MAG TPA: Rieske (2Fe-2S) protein [Micromonosporaceae bacterium]
MPQRSPLDQLAATTWLDRVGDPLRRAVQNVISARARDALHGIWFGHPVHPAMVMFPLGAWLSAAVLDLNRRGKRAATLLIGLGAVGAVPAAVAGYNDWASLSREQRRVGLAHAASNNVAVWLYLASLVARSRGRRGRLLAYGGLAAAATGSYLGGHLAYRQGAGVNQAVPFLRRIPDGWHDLCAVDGLVAGKPVVAHIGEVPVLVARAGEDITVMIERCGHHTGPLGEGEPTRVDGVDCVVCPWHGSTFRLTDGTPVHGPAASGQPVLRSRIADGRVEASLP